MQYATLRTTRLNGLEVIIRFGDDPTNFLVIRGIEGANFGYAPEKPDDKIEDWKPLLNLTLDMSKNPIQYAAVTDGYFTQTGRGFDF
ncbi:MAG: hypothetical protein FWC98_05400 [Bacteroidales bacterium]|nr:hypothetical protein [Bacteroidales bacterium]